MHYSTEHLTTRRQTLGLAAGSAAGLMFGSNERRTDVIAPNSTGSPLVLVHGAFTAAWCWEEVIISLAKTGQSVAAPDLPGHGDDRTPVSAITLQSYVDRVLADVDQLAEPVVLVGHSMGGVVISQVAEQHPDRVRALVYVAAYLLRDGESLLDSALTDTDSLLGAHLRIDEPNGVGVLADAAIVPLFYHDCPPAVATAAAERVRLQREPLAPLATAIRVSDANFGSIPRFYISTLFDRVVSPGWQEQMHAATPGGQRTMIGTGHAPFLARPGELSSLLTLLSHGGT